MSPLELLGPNTTGTLVLLGARVGGLVLIAPLFSSRLVPVRVRAALLVALTWLLFPAALAASTAPVRITPAAALAETLVGAAIGLGAAVFIGAAEAMGDLLSINIGISGAAALDPLTNEASPVLAQFAGLFALTVLLSVDAHLLMLEGVAASLRHLPIGGELDLPGGLAAMVSLGSLLFLCGLRFAAPVLAAVLLSNVALGILSRAAPQFNVLSIAFPLQIGIGLLALAASLSVLAASLTGWDAAYEGAVGGMLRALDGGR